MTAAVSSTAAVLVAQEQRRTAAAARASQLESLAQKILRSRLTSHFIGWSDDSWDLLRQAARISERRDGNLQALAVGSLQGLDARVVKEFPDAGTSSMAFDPSGRRLLMGGCTDPKDRARSNLPSRLWDKATQRVHELRSTAKGPVGFLSNGTPIQLVASKEGASVALVNMNDGQTIHEFQTDGKLVMEDEDVPSTAMTADGTLIGATVRRMNGDRALVIWDGATGRLRQSFKTDARCLTFSPDRSLVAAGDAKGQITIWSLATGQVLAHIQAGRAPIHCLSLFHERRTSSEPNGKHELAGWLVAIGGGGGVASVWDLGTGIRRAAFAGGHYDIYVVAFSPDGTMLATAGRISVNLWDIAGNRHVLRLDGRVPGVSNYIHGLAFAPDGRRLAVGGEAAFGGPGGASLLELNDARGVRTLRGLSGYVETVAFSADGRRIAALAHDWQVGIWNRDDGQLLRVFDVPVGAFADHAALAFSPDGCQFAFSSGREARLWDIETGIERGAWTVPPGLFDRLAFRGSDELIQIRQETMDGVPPLREYPARYHPRLCRLRRLLSGGHTEMVREIKEYPEGLVVVEFARGGEYIVIGGWTGSNPRTGSIEILHTREGTRLWSQPFGIEPYYRLDPAGRVLCVNVNYRENQPYVLVEVPTGTYLGTLDADGSEIGPGIRRWMRRAYPTHLGSDSRLLLMERGRPDPFLQIDPDLVDGRVFFNPDDRHVAWGRSDGTVAVLDLIEIQRRLAEVGLGW